MGPEITGLCREHSFELAVGLCRNCGLEFCDECIVRPVKQALCKPCAMGLGGVRSTAKRPPMNRRDLRRRQKSFDARVAARQAPEPVMPVLTDPVMSDHDPIGPPSGDDLDRIGIGIDDFTDADNAVIDEPTQERTDDHLDPEVAETLAAAFAVPAPVEPDPQPDQVPGDEVAPRIDWSRPFG